MLQLLKPLSLEPLLLNERSCCNEKPSQCNKEMPRPAATREGPCAATKTRHSQKINRLNQSISLFFKVIFPSPDILFYIRFFLFIKFAISLDVSYLLLPRLFLKSSICQHVFSILIFMGTKTRKKSVKSFLFSTVGRLGWVSSACV